MAPVLVKVSAPVPDASMLPPLLVMVNNRSVLTAAPVYLRVPPSNTRLAATLLDAPMLLFAAPLAKLDTDKIPPEIVVAPV